MPYGRHADRAALGQAFDSRTAEPHWVQPLHNVLRLLGLGLISALSEPGGSAHAALSACANACASADDVHV